MTIEELRQLFKLGKIDRVIEINIKTNQIQVIDFKEFNDESDKITFNISTNGNSEFEVPLDDIFERFYTGRYVKTFKYKLQLKGNRINRIKILKDGTE